MGYTRKDVRDDLDAIYVDTGNTAWTAAQKNSAINQAIDALWPECKASKKDDSKVLVADTYLYTPTGQPTELGYSQAFLEQESDEEYLLLRRVSQYRELVSGVLKWIIDIPKDIVDNNDAGKTILLRYHGPFDHYTGDQYIAATISFDSGSKEIRDSANGLAFVLTGDSIVVAGSTDNDGTYTVATGGVAAKIVTSEAVTDEAAGASVTVGVGTVTDQDVPYLPVLYYAQMVLSIIMQQKSAGSSDMRTWERQEVKYLALWSQSKKDNLVLSMARHIGLRRR